MSRADKYTVEFKKPTYYQDFLNTFESNPLTGSLATVSNEDAVNQSIRNLILTNRYERYEQPTLGSKMNSLLFEPPSPIVQEQIINQITETISNCERRVNDLNVQVDPREDLNAYIVTVTYSLINIPYDISFNLILKRVR